METAQQETVPMLQIIWISTGVSIATGDATDNSTWNVNDANVSEDGIGIECAGTILAQKGVFIVAESSDGRGNLVYIAWVLR